MQNTAASYKRHSAASGNILTTLYIATRQGEVEPKMRLLDGPFSEENFLSPRCGKPPQARVGSGEGAFLTCGPQGPDYADDAGDEIERIASGLLPVLGVLVVMAATAAGVVIFALSGW
jgi:hypothetical protein